jgi:N-acetylmuramoyl-L-alanine amidase
MKLHPTFRLLPFAFTLLMGCSPKGPYALTNKVYKGKSDSIAKVIELAQPVMLTDSSGAPVASDFVGTVNFNMRKPNYVIIHFTAQDSIGQTLHTFTIAKTQVTTC